ncbi:MAG TPA: acyl-CoA dehydrogenase family protein [Noviherbaspirillum sp.]|nr:acyl-CoA dehydrogenase family protein [Noviherbaspirillum sp.]
MLRPESAEDARLRAEVAQWLREHVPAHLRHRTFRPEPAEALAWYRKLSARGWIAPHWPRAWGGMEATPVQQVILMEEFARAGAPDLPTQGLNHIGPILIKCGSDAQRARHLPAILNGEVIWCQGYSEPQAGSDLASLRTRAALQGGDLVINGHKIWTTWGQHAHWMFALVRTGEGSGRQEGISFVLIDLSSPGITRRPITTIAGDDEFCEVFFDDVRVPLENVVGELGQGWKVATALLSEERLRIGSPALALKALERLRMMASDERIGAARRPEFQERLALAEIEVETLIASYLSVAESEAQAEGGRPDSSYLKILATETVQCILDSLQEIAGEAAALARPVASGDALLDFSEMFLQSRRLSIYGGTNEIQRTILATRVLGLPVARRSRA